MRRKAIAGLAASAALGAAAVALPLAGPARTAAAPGCVEASLADEGAQDRLTVRNNCGKAAR